MQFVYRLLNVKSLLLVLAVTTTFSVLLGGHQLVGEHGAQILALVLLVGLALYGALRWWLLRPLDHFLTALERDLGTGGQPGAPGLSERLEHLQQRLRSQRQYLAASDEAVRKMASVVDNSPNLVAVLDKHWHLDYANPTYWNISGFVIGEALSGARALLLPADSEIAPEQIHEVLANRHARGDSVPKWQCEYRAQCRDGGRRWINQSISAIWSDCHEVEYYICIGQDISYLKENQERIESLAYYDQLTGLHNRVLLKEYLHQSLRHCLREREKMALLYLDLDHFKRVNDSLGHEAGDDLLREVARRLRECLRSEDVVARLGGDEFAVALERVGSAQYAFVVANKIISELNKPLLLDGQEVFVGVSIGITIAPDDSDSIDVLMKNADLAMYQAKEAGRNVFRFYTQEMNEAVEKRLQLEREIRQALKRDEFVLYYQPIVELNTGRVVSAEALIRWQHPERGLLSPAEFIPLAEDSGLIVDVGRWVIRTACQQAKALEANFAEPIDICVNISARQLHDEHFVEDFRLLLEEYRLAPERLTMEITESTLMTYHGAAMERIRALKQLGVGLAIDDFGTGYSSLSHLKRLPVDSLKVDRSFVEDLPDDEEDRAITTLIVAMAKSLRYNVVVEGIETEPQLMFLIERGCQFGQGYYFGRAVPMHQLMAQLPGGT